MNIKEKLIKIQTELKAPKGQYNSFGKYNYRSCEDILEAVKPLLAKYNCVLTVRDELRAVGERYYVEAIATLEDADAVELDENYMGNKIINTAFAREEEEKKGMDGSQITGTASSYARKYCLNGLFLIDDTKDADTDEYRKTTTKEEPKKEVKPITQEEMGKLRMEMLRTGKDESVICQTFNIKDITEITNEMYSKAMKKFAKTADRTDA